MESGLLWLVVRWGVWGAAMLAGGFLFLFHASLVRTWLRVRAVRPRPILAAGFVLTLVAWAALPTSRARFTWPTRALIASEGVAWMLLAQPVLFWLRRRAGLPVREDDVPPGA